VDWNLQDAITQWLADRPEFVVVKPSAEHLLELVRKECAARGIEAETVNTENFVLKLRYRK